MAKEFKIVLLDGNDPDAQYASITNKDPTTQYILKNGKGYLGTQKLFDWSEGSGSNNYRNLDNLPSINGTILYDNYDEIDPTIYPWAKGEIKPSYTYNEVGAVGQENELGIAEVMELWEQVFPPST